jgi:two-component system, OmpR family, phosphate regulon response regulator PhoB
MQVSRVLVVDGNRATRDALVTCLQFVGVEAHGAECAVSARFWLASGGADVLVLADDPATNPSEEKFAELVQRCAPANDAIGASVLWLVREGAAATPSPNYRVDETLCRPVAVGHVVQRIESLIDRRRERAPERLTFASLTLDVAAARLSLDGRELALGRTETRLLAFFMLKPERVFSRVQLLQRLWPANVRVAERTVDVHIRRLRAALAQLECADYIQTVRSAGYRFSRQLE